MGHISMCGWMSLLYIPQMCQKTMAEVHFLLSVLRSTGPTSADEIRGHLLEGH